jgi:[ribosomal protein S5]-alanine N-acetyltransferase
MRDQRQPDLMEICTDRLRLRPLTALDAMFVHRLMNDEAWLANIGDRGIRSPLEARLYLEEGPWTRYADLGFGFYAVELQCGLQPMGVCGLAKRPHLDAPDIGFAFLPEYRGAGYALEAARAVLDFAASLGLSRIVATTRPSNDGAKRILRLLQMTEESSLISPSSGQPLLLYAANLPVARKRPHSV